MFSSSLTSGQRWWLLALLAVWAVLLFGGFLLGSAGADTSRRMPLSTRLLSSLVLVVAGWSWFFFCRGAQAERFGLLVALGMSFGLLGDLYMAGLIPLGNRVLGGMAAFGIGHIFYISAFVGFGNQQGLAAPGPRWGALAAWLLIGLVGWYVVVFRGQQATALHWAALPYALLLASAAGFAAGLALQSPRFLPLALGGALFLVSDLILAGQLFSGLSFRLIGDVIWLTYGPGQMLIVYAIGAALAWVTQKP
jgi:hypothetical protein